MGDAVKVNERGCLKQHDVWDVEEWFDRGFDRARNKLRERNLNWMQTRKKISQKIVTSPKRNPFFRGPWRWIEFLPRSAFLTSLNTQKIPFNIRQTFLCRSLSFLGAKILQSFRWNQLKWQVNCRPGMAKQSHQLSSEGRSQTSSQMHKVREAARLSICRQLSLDDNRICIIVINDPRGNCSPFWFTPVD